MKDRVNMTLDADLVKRLKKMADEQQRTISNLVNLLLRQALDIEKSKN